VKKWCTPYHKVQIPEHNKMLNSWLQRPIMNTICVNNSHYVIPPDSAPFLCKMLQVTTPLFP